MNKYLAIILLSFVFSGLWAGNSIFSNYGYPTLDLNYDTYSAGMGKTGSADLFHTNFSFINPSIVAAAPQVLFATGVKMGYVYYEDENGAKYTDNAMNFPYFNIAIPIKKHKFGFAFTSMYGGDLETEIPRTYNYIDPETNTSSAVDFTEKHTVDANIFKFDLIYAYPFERFNLGVAFNYYLGHRVVNTKRIMPSPWITSIDETEDKYKGGGATVGFSKNYGNYAVGVFYASKAFLSGDAHYKTIASETKYADAEFVIPQKLGGGFTYRLNPQFKFSFDTVWENWAEENNYGPSRNTFMTGLGFAYDPLSGEKRWYKKIPLRTGINYRTLPFKAENGYLDETTLSMGFSVPLESVFKKFDFSVDYAFRGDKSKNGFSENTLYFNIGISSFDVFRKRVKRTEHRDIPVADKK